MAAEATKLTLAVLISGGGTNLQAMIDRAESGELDARIALVVSNNPEAYGLVRARNHDIPTAVVDYGKYGRKQLPRVPLDALPTRFAEVAQRQRLYRGLPQPEVEDRLARLVLAEQEVIRAVDRVRPDVICLAGFMRLLSPYFIGHFQGDGRYRIMNIHPALLPAFPGEHGYEDTFTYGCKIGGTTVHFVDEGEDTGPVIAQAVYPIWPEDSLELIRQRGLQLEYALYPRCIQWMAEGHLRVTIGAEGRPVVQILDPTYPDFLQGLIRQAFVRPA
jgi:phosphoribosylglycinamide formyltransferase-1